MGKKAYFWLFTAATLVYIPGLEVTIMDVDSAQYASISREIAETGDFLQVKHMGEDYLDKPPLLFWVSALFFKLFGIYNWSFKIGSFLFTLLGVYSTFRLGKLLYNAETGRLAALLLYTCQAFFLFNNDVRTDTILTGSVAFAIWQLIQWLQDRRGIWLIGSGVGIGLAMLAKGPIGLMVPVLAVGSYIIGKQAWKDLFRWQYLVVLGIAALILVPMLWGLYQQFDMHPEKTVMMVTPDGLKPEKGVSGVKFYLWTQSFGRITGENVWKDTSGPFFFVHNFLWSYLPWAFLFVFALFTRLRQAFLDLIWAGRVPEMLTTMGFILPFIALSLSAYKLPHYIFVLYPLSSILVAWWWNEKVFGQHIRHPWLATSLIIQVMIAIASGVLLYHIYFRFFPNAPVGLVVVTGLLLAASLYFFTTYRRVRLHLIIASVLVSLAVNFTMNMWFYPGIMQYQAGSQIAHKVKELHIDPDNLHYFNAFTFSMGFYLQGSFRHIRPEDINRQLQKGGEVFLVVQEPHLSVVKKLYDFEVLEEFNTFKATRLSFGVLLPELRKDHFEKYYLLKITGSEHQS